MSLRTVTRGIAHAPFHHAVIILSLAVGIGVNTVVFSWLRQAVFSPLPGIGHPVAALETKDDTGNYVPLSWLEYKDVRAMLPSFTGVLAHRPRAYNLGENERDQRIFGMLVSENYFELLGLRPHLGRFFLPEEATRPGQAPVVVLSHAFWRGHYREDPGILGRTLKLNGRALTVVGVAPEGFHGAMHSLSFDVFLPLTIAAELQPASTELSSRATRNYYMLALPKSGIPAAQLRGELDAAAARLRKDYPETNKGFALELMPLWRAPRGGQLASTGLATLQVFAFLILLVVCANTASLQLARASTRRREIGVRLALGAGPGRIVAQLLGESLLLAGTGAALGVFLALWGVDLIRQMPVPGTLPVRLGLELDWGGLVFALLLGGGCGVLFGLAPALQLGRTDVQTALRAGRGSTAGRSRLRSALIGVEVATALVVLVLAGLFLKSFRNARTASPGYDTPRVLLASLDLAGRGYNADRGRALLDELLARLRQAPGIEQAAMGGQVPLEVRGLPTGVISVEGKEFDPGRKILYYNVSPGYFATLGIPIVSGADLAPLGRVDLPLDAVINEEMARRYWPGESPVGRRFEVSKKHYVVAGVVPSVKLTSLNEAPRPAAWLTLRAQFVFTPTLHVRATAGADPLGLAAGVRSTLRQLDPELPALDVRTLAQHVDNNLFLQRLPAQMLAVIGPLALALAAIGLYAVLAYSLAQRTQEIGVRIALGATPGGVVRQMVREGMAVALAGSTCGLIVALGAGWFFRPVLVGVPFGDPLIYLGIPTLLLAVAALACWLPARRAARVDPLIALRAE